jgi:glucokinase
MSLGLSVLAVDVGGTSLKGAVVGDDGRFLYKEAVPLDGERGETIFELLRDLLDRLRQEAALHRQPARAVSVITPGMDDRGCVMFASNLGWRDMPLRDRLEKYFSLPVATGHDVRTAGAAEARFGAARGAQDFAMVMLGTGIAAALFANGQPIAGARSMGGEFGHMPVIPGGEICPCGQRGCLEAYGSAGGIVRRFRAAGGDPRLTAAEIAGAVGVDERAGKVWREAVAALGQGLVILTMLLDPALLVIGGGLAEAGEILLGPLRDALRAGLLWRAPPPLAVSTLGASGALLGAAALGFERLGLGALVKGWNDVGPGRQS